MEAARTHLPGLDGLRGITVLAVVAYHLGLPKTGGGFLGVDVFFVVSGYLVTSLLAAELLESGRINIMKFWIRRVRRLMPALLVLLAAAGAVYGFRLPEKLAGGRLDLAAGAGYASNWRMISTSTSYFEQLGRPPLTRHLWSLAIEGQFYLAWPLVLVALAVLCATDRFRMAVATALLGAISLAWCAVLFDPKADPSRVYFGTDTRLVAVLVGAALALFRSRTRRAGQQPPIEVDPWSIPPRTVDQLKLASPAVVPASQERLGRPLVGWLNVFGVASAISLLVCFVLVSDRSPLLYRGGFGAVAVLTAVVVWAATVHGTLLARLCSWAPLRWFGVRSYSLYLWHWPVIALTQPGLDFSATANQWVVAGGRFLVSLALTELSFRIIEEPFRRKLFGRWVASIVGRPGAVLRTPRWYVGTVAAMLLIVGGAAGVSRAAQNDGIADSLRIPGDEVLVGSAIAASARPAVTVAAPAVVVGAAPAVSGSGRAVATSAPPTTFPTPPPDPRLPATTTVEGLDPLGSTRGAIVAPTNAVNTSVSTAAATSVSTAAATTPGTIVPVASTMFPRPPGVLAIGDSIMKGASPALAARLGDGSVIDAAVSRPFTAGVGVLEKQTGKGRQFGAIVVHLGNNGVPSPKQFREFMAKAGTATPVVFITMRESREWAPKLNALLRSETKDYRNVRIMEWNEAAGGYSYLFAKDKLHLSGTGGRYYSDLVVWNLAQAGYVGAPTPPAATEGAPTAAASSAPSTTATTPMTPMTSVPATVPTTRPGSTASGASSTAISSTTTASVALTKSTAVIAAKTVKTTTRPTATMRRSAKVSAPLSPTTVQPTTPAPPTPAPPTAAAPSTTPPTQPPSTKPPETTPPSTAAPEPPAGEASPPS